MDMLIEYPDGDSNVERAVGDYLELLSNNHPKILYRAMDRGGSAEYRVDFEEACTWLRLGEITRTIEAKFGIPSRRIWNIVHDKGKLDDKHVSKLGLLAPKEARERLYNLFRSKFLYMTAVPKGNDRSAQRTFFLYYTNVAKTSEILLNNVYATVAKLRNRYQHEMSRWEKLLSKIQRAEQEGEEILNEMDRRNKDNLDKIVDRLEIAERRLAEMTIILPE